MYDTPFLNAISTNATTWTYKRDKWGKFAPTHSSPLSNSQPIRKNPVHQGASSSTRIQDGKQ